VEDQSVDDMSVCPSTPEKLPRLERLTLPYYCHIHKEENTGHSCRRLPSEGNRGSNMLGRPSL